MVGRSWRRPHSRRGGTAASERTPSGSGLGTTAPAASHFGHGVLTFHIPCLFRTEPRTDLLRYGLDESTPHGYDLHEEEVPRAGARVTQSFQRTRWYGGQVFIWFGVRKETGRGERSSGLAFDRIPPKRRG